MRIIIEEGSAVRKMRRKPTHPGEILRLDYLDPLSITVTEMAAHLKVSRKTLSKVLNGRGAVTADMALRLSRLFDTSPDLWLNLQMHHDLWCAERSSNEWKQIKPLPLE